MSHRTDFYFRQRLSEAEIDLAFALLEQADRNLAGGHRRILVSSTGPSLRRIRRSPI